MAAYWNRLKEGCPTYRFVIWWIFRALMLFAFFVGLIGAIRGTGAETIPEGTGIIKQIFLRKYDITDPLQVGANLIGMFVWEIFQLFPKKNMLRHVPSVVQTFLIIGIFCASFGGKFLNLYYSFRWWDVVLHLIGGGACVFFGYELACAIQKRDRVTAPVSMVLMAAVGFSFLASTGWELFEFTFDQIATKSAAAAGDIMKSGDAQHWCLALAEGTPKALTLFDPCFPERWPLMDTMADTVLNTVGAVISFIFLKIFPYRHRGKNDLNKEFEGRASVSKAR